MVSADMCEHDWPGSGCRECRAEREAQAKIPTQHELEVLRILNGEDVPGWVAGAAMWACAASLVGMGYARGTYEITQSGKDYLASLEA